MLQMILGRTGTGKTTYVRNFLKEQAENTSDRLFYIVPEQNSFDSERAILNLLGEKKARRVEVVSFTRLTDSVMREYGGMAGRRLDDCGRSMFMNMALEQVADRLTLYRTHTEDEDFIAQLLQTQKELKMCGISPEQLLTAGQKTAQHTLRQKAEELSLIFGAYDALVAQSFVDPLDDLKKLENLLREHTFFENAVVVLDAFKGFTAQELHIIEQIMLQAKTVYLTLCTEKLGGEQENLGLFCTVQQTAASFLKMARRHELKVASPIRLEENKRFCNTALLALEHRLFQPENTAEGIFEEGVPVERISICAAAQKYAEAEAVAATIHRMVREKGFRYRDFTVIMRSEGDYAGVIDDALEKYHVPYFMDLPQEIYSKPLFAFVLQSLNAVQDGWDSDDIFRLLKTELCPFSVEEIAELENYCFLWGISGKQWEEEWRAHPRGFHEEMTEEDIQALVRLNQMRQTVIEPLIQLKNATKQAEGEKLAAAVFHYLERCKTGEQLKELAARFARQGLAVLSEEQLRLWDILVDILDQTALVLRNTVLDLKKFIKLFRLSVQTAKISFIPQTLDQVLVGGADRIRPDAPKYVFLLGVNQGVFPASVDSFGLLSDQERKLLKQIGLELSADAEEQAAEERFLAYTSLCCASEGAFLSYAEATVGGDTMYPSELINEVRRILPMVPIEQITEEYGMDAIEGEEQAFELLANQWNRENDEVASLRTYFQQNESYCRSVAAMERISEGKPMQFQTSENAKQLFGKDMRLSPSRVEKYHLCPFSYFCQYGLNAKARRAAKIDAMEYGTLIHYLLENILRRYSKEELCAASADSLKKEAVRLLQSYMEENLGGFEDKSERFLYLYHRFEKTAVSLVLRMADELRQSEFVPADFELEIGETVEPMRLELPDGGSICVQGKIDRVDVMKSNGKAYVRVVDYKTGGKQFYLKDVVYGLNMQMLIYLITLWQKGSSRYGEVVPAGVLYMPATAKKIEGKREESAEETSQRQADTLKMSGMVLDEPLVIRGMERNVAGIYIPVKYTKEGKPNSFSQIYSLAQMGYLSRHIISLLKNMGTELHQGNIGERPREHACEYCDFADVCGREPEDGAEIIPQMKNDEIFARLQEQYGEEEG